jgi:hypothetical protein
VALGQLQAPERRPASPDLCHAVRTGDQQPVPAGDRWSGKARGGVRHSRAHEEQLSGQRCLGLHFHPDR